MKSKKAFQIGIDLGGTKIESIILDVGKEIYRNRIATEQENGYNHILNQILKLYTQCTQEIKSQNHTFGIGTPGSISLRNGLLKNSNTLCLNQKPFKKDLEKLLNRNIVIQNDANCFAAAEATLGAGISKDNVFGIIMGTGCGGGWFNNKAIHEGLQSIGGEWGHMSIDPNGPLCYCGSKGCVETLISGGGLEKQYFEKSKHRLPAEEIFNLFHNHDPLAKIIIDSFFKNYGRSVANLINILDPDIIVLGGGLSNVDGLYTDGYKWVEHFIFNDECQTPIVKNKLGDSAGVIGSALIGV